MAGVGKAFERSVHEAIGCGVDVLLQAQDPDGFWREFQLRPGASEAWSTAWVGWCLRGTLSFPLVQEQRVRLALGRALSAIARSRSPGGWGFNRTTGPDADTTSWAIRFAAACGLDTDPAAYLEPYVDPGGGVHTFRELDLGTWTDAHDDVACNAGLALLSARRSATHALRERIRSRLERRFPGETFWWSTPVYGASWSVRFLAACGPLSGPVRASVDAWLAALPESESSFEVVHKLMALLALHCTQKTSVALVNQLLDLQCVEGWNGPAFLLVPDRSSASPIDAAPAYPELRGLLTTALCARTLAEWLGQYS